MKKLIRIVLPVIILLSLVHLTQDIIEFSREIITLKDVQLKAKYKETRMMHPTVKITSILLSSSSNAGEAEYAILSSATGFSIDYDPGLDQSIIVTNEHFCKINNPEVSFMIEDYKKSSLEKSGSFLVGEVIISKESLDLCLIKANGYIRPAKLASYHYTPAPFEEIYIVGGPSGTFPIIFDSYISRVITRKDIELGRMGKDGNDLLLISEQVFPGHSGSPVFTKDGRVIGIIFGALRSYGGLAVSVKDIYKLLEEIK